MKVLSLCALLLCVIATAAQADPIRMARVTPYADGARIAGKIKDECTRLPTQLADFTKEFGAEFGVEVELVDSVDAASEGRVLQVEITDAVSRGNPFIGHRKYTDIEGTLYENGATVASFRGSRESMGGVFGGYKGSCSVLGRTMKALGKDIAQWLRDPEDGAELGDL